MVVLTKAGVFLLHVDCTKKTYVPSQSLNISEKPIFAEDVLLHNLFTLDKDSLNKYPDYSLIQKNDYIIVFCGPLVPHSPNQIKFIFKVKNKLGSQIVLFPFLKLNRGYKLEHIKSLIAEGKLTQKMLNCGNFHIKISRVDFSDLELLVNYDPIVRTYYSSSWKI